MPIEINSRTDISFENCAFKPQRQELALFFTEYLSTKEQGFVFNLDGEWGSGKSFFIKAWMNEIKNDHPVCYIDSWITDFSDNPLIVIIHSILNSLNEDLKKSIGFDPNSEKRFIESALNFIKNSSSISQPILKLFSPELWATAKATDKLSDILLQVVKNTKTDYDSFKESINGLEEFKKELEILVDTIIGGPHGTLSKPLYIFIDELDRCRPTYAIEVLETIKHLFDCPNIVFVIATNKTELVKSISHVYGAEFSSSEYLSRFFDRSASLPKAEISSFLKVKKVQEELELRISNASVPINSYVTKIGEIFTTFNISLRQSDKLIEQLYSVLDHIKRRGEAPFNILVTMLCLKEKFSNIYDKNNLTFNSLAEHLEKTKENYNTSNKISSRYEKVSVYSFIKDTLNAEQLLSNYKDNPNDEESTEELTGLISDTQTEANKLIINDIRERVNRDGYFSYNELKNIINMAHLIN